MPPATGTALLLLIGFVLPGFVTQAVAERTRVQPRQRDGFERLLWALYYSALVYAILGIGISLLALIADRPLTWNTIRSEPERDHSVGGTVALFVFVVLVIPSLIAVVGGLWNSRKNRA